MPAGVTFGVSLSPIFAASFCRSWARSGSSKPSHVSIVTDALLTPACCMSALAFSRSCLRCATLLSVDGNTGANGLSLPKSDLPAMRPLTSAARSTASAIAWRTRLSSNGFLSLRMWISRWTDARSSMTVTFGSLRSALPPVGEKWISTSTSPDWSARTWACSLG